jgi:PEP-CTERM motif
MRSRSMIFGMAVLGLTQLVTGSSVLADFSTNPQNFSIPLTPTNWGPGTASIVTLDPLAVSQFNAAQYSVNGKIAVLTGVLVGVEYEFQNTLSMQFFNMSTISVKATGSLSVQNSAGTPFLTSTPFSNSQTLAATPSTLLGKNVTFPTQTFFGVMATPGNGLTGTTTLQSFSGTGTITLPVVASASSTFTTSSGNGYGSSVTEALANVHVIYRYILVPEPSSLVLAGLGFVGLLAVCRQRNRLKGLKAA